MKVRDICLMMSGAVIAVAGIAIAVTLFNPSKAQAQGAASAPAAGGVALVVSAGNATTAGSLQGGTIVLQDTVNRKVTVTAYSFQLNSGSAPTLSLSANSSYTY